MLSFSVTKLGLKTIYWFWEWQIIYQLELGSYFENKLCDEIVKAPRSWMGILLT